MRSQVAIRLGVVAGLVAALFLTSLRAQVVAAGPLQAVAPDGTVVTATYEGAPIEPHTASSYFCHTRDWPVVRCFASQAEVDSDLDWVEPTEPGDSPASASDSDVSPDWNYGTPYSLAYWDINYGGSVLTLYGNVTYLGLIGWNDSISSFKSVNCGIPRYYIDSEYSGMYWQNGCNTWSPNLYSYNDSFSSVVNLAP